MVIFQTSVYKGSNTQSYLFLLQVLQLREKETFERGILILGMTSESKMVKIKSPQNF